MAIPFKKKFKKNNFYGRVHTSRQGTSMQSTISAQKNKKEPTSDSISAHLSSNKDEIKSLSPMLKQYHAIKSNHQDCVLFFRLGDFYEMFYEDAKIVSKELDLVLTSRGKNSLNKTPMCGFPHHASQNYIAKLVKAGFKIAICDQTEDPSQAKGIVKREVTRIISSGTFLDEDSFQARFILSINFHKNGNGFSFCDPTTGTIQANESNLDKHSIAEIILTLPVYECIFPESQKKIIEDVFNNPNLKQKNIALSAVDDWCFNHDIARQSLCDHFQTLNLRGFGLEEKASATCASGALLQYLKQMNKQPLKHIDRLSLFTNEDTLFISPAAFNGLELNNFIHSINYTQTAIGKRLFYCWMTHPLKNAGLIITRQQAISQFKNHNSVQNDIKTLFQNIPDIEKNISRLSCGYTHSKDLLAIRNTLNLLPEIKKSLMPLSLRSPLFLLDDIKPLRQYLENTINENIPLSKPEGKVICPGVNKELDDLKGIQQNGREWLKNLQQEEIKRTGINSLKIGFNKVFGYYIEITTANKDLVPDDYIRKQTLVNAERFITPSLKEYEQKILTAEEKILKIEQELIEEVVEKILSHSKCLHACIRQLSTIDVLYSFTQLSQKPDYIVPKITEDLTLEIIDGRHPVVEQTLTETFVSNDTYLNDEEDHLIILTGPNMSGKSTYIRQTALLIILAQTGSFIPATRAKIGLVDKIFTRIGAHDDISKGQSTFMVEMNETADILNNLTDRSLVILDEIGRGTSTYDGLSLAWSLAEYLQKTRTRTLFATHFHELTALADEYPGVRNYNVAVKKWKDEIIFLHKIIPGGSDDSYGIYVAKLAGIPKAIITRARQILTKLEMKNDLKENLTGKKPVEEQINLFNQENDPVADEIKSTLELMNINDMTPVEALLALQELCAQATDNPIRNQ